MSLEMIKSPDTTAPQHLQAPAIGAAWPEQGGIYAGIIRGEGGKPDRHVIVPEGEQFTITGKWGARGVDVSGATSRTDGAANTAAMAQAGCEIAKQVQAMQTAGLTDLHIPSRGELQLCAANVPELFSKAHWYWSSTQGDRSGAFAQDFAYGDSNWHGKANEFRVRAVRAIQLQPFTA